MEITDLKLRVDIVQVANKLGIQTDRNGKALCPFHNDKSPSLQFSKDKQICTCFSSKCNAGTMDVIGLAEKKLNLNTHEAIKYLQNMTGEIENGKLRIENKKTKISQMQESVKIEIATPDYTADFEQMQSSLLSSSIARNYLESRNLNRDLLQVGYNAFKGSKFNYLKGCVTFALKNKKGEIVSLYGRSVKDNDNAKHYYTSNRTGLYPCYPSAETRKLIITESIIDTATLMQLKIENGELKIFELLAAYGTNGITEEHSGALSQLKELEEIILFFDGDEAGRKGAEKAANELHELLPNVIISKVDTIEGEDINSLSIGHETEIFIDLLQNRKPYKIENGELKVENEKFKNAEKDNFQSSIFNSQLNVSNQYKISYSTAVANYFVKGGIPKALDSMKVTLEIEQSGVPTDNYKKKSRSKVDLYEDRQTEKAAREAGEKLNIRADLIEQDLNYLTDLLDEYREQTMSADNKEEEKKPVVTAEQQTKCINFLKRKQLIKEFNKLIEQAGITGEDNNRIFLFVIATAYKMPDTLHALIQGSSGSGKTYLSKQITDLMPKEDVIRLTRVTESSFYNYGEYEIQYKLIVLEDVDGLKEEAEYAFRELQSNGEIISSTSAKDENSGQIRAQIKKVKGPIGSIATTTKGEIYEDNMSRIFLLAVDESKDQTNRIINYLNQRASGGINKKEEMETKEFIQNCIRLLKPYEVVNPYANKILLPPEAHKIRRLTELFHAFVNQVTLLNQYQRQRTQDGRLITEKEDVETAIEIMFESIVLKVDELDGSLRQFYEDLKTYIINKGEGYKEYQFGQMEIRQALHIKKTRLSYYLNELQELEYISQSGYSNRGYRYKITYWDNLEAMRTRIKTFMQNQLENL